LEKRHLASQEWPAHCRRQDRKTDSPGGEREKGGTEEIQTQEEAGRPEQTALKRPAITTETIPHITILQLRLGHLRMTNTTNSTPPAPHYWTGGILFTFIN